MHTYPTINLVVQSTYTRSLVRIRPDIDAHKAGFIVADKSLSSKEMLTRIEWALQGLTHTKDIKAMQMGLEVKPEWLISTGSRGGCEVNGETSLTTLAPHKHIGRTASTHPTFAWFVPESKPFSLEFRLYKYVFSGNIQLAYKTGLKSSPGIMKLSLPRKNPGLTFGQRYIWQVALLCDPHHPSSDLVARAEIEAIKMPPIWEKKIFGAGDRNLMIEQLAKAGLWYDCLGEALAISDGSLRKVVATLLEDLASLEEPATQVNNRSINLRQIARSSEVQPTQ